jgi:hypothetical protein
MIEVKLDGQHLVKFYNAKFNQNSLSNFEHDTREQVGAWTDAAYLLCVYLTDFIKNGYKIHLGTSVRGAAIDNHGFSRSG